MTIAIVMRLKDSHYLYLAFRWTKADGRFKSRNILSLKQFYCSNYVTLDEEMSFTLFWNSRGEMAQNTLLRLTQLVSTKPQMDLKHTGKRLHQLLHQLAIAAVKQFTVRTESKPISSRQSHQLLLLALIAPGRPCWVRMFQCEWVTWVSVETDGSSDKWKAEFFPIKIDSNSPVGGWLRWKKLSSPCQEIL